MSARLARPLDATLSVTRAARLLGVHPNTIRAWSDAGRLRHFRINCRGDRRFRLGDLQRFIAAEGGSPVRPPGRTARGTLVMPEAARPREAAARSRILSGEQGQRTRWGAELASIQQLGARLNRLATVDDIGRAIVSELRRLVDPDNVRVYRLVEDELIPFALEGWVGEYAGETADQLRIAIGEGITGWVAAHKTPQLLRDAARDPRARTVPGSTADLDESIIAAPMVYGDVVLGVIVLTKLGLGQFSDDDLRVLEIYASFAAQALSNAEASGQLREKSAAVERLLQSQRDLLSITQSILATLDPHGVLEQVADRLNDLVGYENLAIEVVDRETGELRRITSRGPHAAWFLTSANGAETGLAWWVTQHAEAMLIRDERSDPRLRTRHRRRRNGSLIAVPLLGRSGPRGALILERLGTSNRYTDAEFELVQLFAGQVSIALQNAEIHRAVQIQAATDVLTGLLNHRSFQDRLAAQVAAGGPFGLIMLDLDTFKDVNDALGHQAGDRLLAEIARALRTASRDVDLAFRYGGDEFTVVLPGADAPGAMVVAERLLSAICRLGEPGSPWSRRGLRIGASLGLATFPDDAATAAGILLAADRACQFAKRSGRARISTAAEGVRLAAEFVLKEPTPVDSRRS